MAQEKYKQKQKTLNNFRTKTIENLGEFAKLEELNICFNSIQKIENLSRLTKLRKLNLSENQIAKIENIECLSLLEELNLDGNRIERIPKNIEKLKRLSVLKLERNKLSIVSTFLRSDRNNWF